MGVLRTTFLPALRTCSVYRARNHLVVFQMQTCSLEIVLNSTPCLERRASICDVYSRRSAAEISKTARRISSWQRIKISTCVCLINCKLISCVQMLKCSTVQAMLNICAATHFTTATQKQNRGMYQVSYCVNRMLD